MFNILGHKRSANQKKEKEMQIITTLRFHLIPVRLAIFNNTNNNKCCLSTVDKNVN
jgi:hypothetical protein